MSLEKEILDRLVSIDNKLSPISDLPKSLEKISEKCIKIESGQDNTNSSLMRIVYALIALISASLGLKFIGSPPLVIIGSFISFFAATYLLTATIFQWKQLKLLLKLLRLVFSSFIYFSVIGRNFVFKVGESPSPVWFGQTVDIFFIVLCILLLMMSWKLWENNKTGHKKLDGDEICQH